MNKNVFLKVSILFISALTVTALVVFLLSLFHNSKKGSLLEFINYDQQSMQMSYWHKEDAYPVPISLKIDKEALLVCFKETKIDTYFTIDTKNTARFIIQYISKNGVEMQLVIYDNNYIMLTTLNQSVPYRSFFKDKSDTIFETIKQMIIH